MMDGCDDEELVPCSGYTGEPQSPHRKVVHLTGGPHWGFRTCGGRDTNIQLRIARVSSTTGHSNRNAYFRHDYLKPPFRRSQSIPKETSSE